jgi:hypothetical protein
MNYSRCDRGADQMPLIAKALRYQKMEVLEEGLERRFAYLWDENDLG